MKHKSIFNSESWLNNETQCVQTIQLLEDDGTEITSSGFYTMSFNGESIVNRFGTGSFDIIFHFGVQTNIAVTLDDGDTGSFDFNFNAKMFRPFSDLIGFTRSDLDDIAEAFGLQSSDYSSKQEVAEAIVGVRG